MNERAKFLKIHKDQIKRMDETREQFSYLYDYIEKNCKPSRETSLAFTKLEEAQFWAIKGITREVEVFKESEGD
jgi:hypothetical protein